MGFLLDVYFRNVNRSLRSCDQFYMPNLCHSISKGNRVFLVIFRGISGEIFPGCSDLDFPCSFL